MPVEQLVVALAGVGGLAGAAVALIKARPERDLIYARVAEGALNVQVTLVDQLEDALKRVQGDVDKLSAEVGELRSELTTVTRERDRLLSENHDLRTRVTHLESEVTRLSSATP